MRVLLLGATGKVGAPVLHELLDRGHDVTAAVRDASRLPAETPALHHRAGDVFDADFLTDAAAGAEVIVCSVALRDPAQRDRTPTDLMRGAGQAAVAAGARLVALGGAGSSGPNPASTSSTLRSSPRWPSRSRLASGRRCTT